MSPVMIQQAAQWSADGCGLLGEPGPQVAAGLPVWNDVCTLPFERFPRLDPLSKLVNVLAEWLLVKQPVSADVGLVLATRYGCVEADLAYYRTAVNTPELASPQLFPYTLPSAGLAEAAIRHRLHGPAAVFLQEPGLNRAFLQARRWLETGGVPQGLVIYADALLTEGALFLQVRPRIDGWAWLLGPEGKWALPEMAGKKNIRPAELFAELEKQVI